MQDNVVGFYFDRHVECPKEEPEASCGALTQD